jgi:hypothetical protein
MAALPGQWLSYAECWEWPDAGRAATPCPGSLVCFAIPMAEKLEGCAMSNPKKKAPAPTKTQNAFQTDTNDLDSATGARQRKDESTLLAQLAQAGHVVHKGGFDDYTVCKFGLAKYCQDLTELRAFALQLGVIHG